MRTSALSTCLVCAASIASALAPPLPHPLMPIKGLDAAVANLLAGAWKKLYSTAGQAAALEMMTSQAQTHCQLWVATPKPVPMSEIIAIAPRLGRTQVPKQSPQARLPCFGCISSSVLCCGVPLHGFGFSLTQPYPMQLINLCLSGLVQDSRTAALPQVMRQLRLYYGLRVVVVLLRPLAKCTQAVQDVLGSFPDEQRFCL